MYDNANNDTLKISGILRVKESSTMNLLAPGIAYSNELTSKIVKDNENSEIVKAQRDTDINVMTNEKLDDATKESTLAYLGEIVSLAVL